MPILLDEDGYALLDEDGYALGDGSAWRSPRTVRNATGQYVKRLEARAGESCVQIVHLWAEDAAADLTGQEVTWTATHASSATPITGTATVLDGPTGEIELDLAVAADTTVGYWSAVIKCSDETWPTSRHSDRLTLVVAADR